MFGNVAGCVKEYRSVGHALNRAKKIKGVVVQVPEGMEVDAGGKVIETIPVEDKPGYVTYQHHALTEFAIPVKQEN